ncbi:MAG TPA: hypothetical protein GX526_01100 [Thermoanaerobacterales bacterium]|nr:hypothetical protein [Thermoanaerobacterales bacterium]
MFNEYDLVRVVDYHDVRFIGAIGIIVEVTEDIDGIRCYRLLYAGEYHNNLTRSITPYLTDEELEVV